MGSVTFDGLSQERSLAMGLEGDFSCLSPWLRQHCKVIYEHSRGRIRIERLDILGLDISRCSGTLNP